MGFMLRVLYLRVKHVHGRRADFWLFKNIVDEKIEESQ